MLLYAENFNNSENFSAKKNQFTLKFKKMEFKSVIIGVVLILMFIVPILYMIFWQSTKDKRRLKKLKDLGSQNQMTLDHYELSNSLLLGLDSKSKKLIVVEPQNVIEFDVIDLSKIDVSAISKKSHAETNKHSGKEPLIRVCLELIKNDPKQKVAEIVFYDEDDERNMDADVQLVLAKKWDELIRMNLSA